MFCSLGGLFSVLILYNKNISCISKICLELLLKLYKRALKMFCDFNESG